MKLVQNPYCTIVTPVWYKCEMSFHRCGDTPGCGVGRRSDFCRTTFNPLMKLPHFCVSCSVCCGGCLVRILVLTAVWEQSAAGRTAVTTQWVGNGLNMFSSAPISHGHQTAEEKKECQRVCGDGFFFFF